MTSSRMFLVFYTTILISFCSVGVSINEDLHVGPCVVRRMKLPRLDPVMVGYVRQVELLKNEELFEVKTLSLKPPIFEIPGFLSETETTRLLHFAENGKLENSDVYHHSMDELQSQTSFEHWDLNRDGVINPDEVISGMRYFRDLHFTLNDVEIMLKSLNVGNQNPGAIHRSEFESKRIINYVQKIASMETKVKGRHSNQTYIELHSNDELAMRLDRKKSALTGLPIELIRGSETPVAVRYGPAGHYHCHYDSHPVHVAKSCCDLRSLDNCRICRYITILYFLNDVEEGGQTAFPIANNETFNYEAWTRQSNYLSNLSAHCSKANLKIAPKRGTAIMWYNHVIDASSGWLSSLDSMSYHGGCDVIKGHKWIVNNWINIIGNDWEDLRTWRDKYSRIIERGGN
ncbi:transmembrane prolyl 4-hydroxylase-like isoform X1 [Acropora palmata]|uniref:transmembrane prolyl 4-hydroxylase-like isoform X1 n=1 Tax=Acropora palmata TaxID=6131 RepID=UPI003DA0FC73